MGDMRDVFDAMKDHRKGERARKGSLCVRCVTKTPNRSPSLLMPGQRCKVDGYVDPRPRDWEPLIGGSGDKA